MIIFKMSGICSTFLIVSTKYRECVRSKYSCVIVTAPTTAQSLISELLFAIIISNLTPLHRRPVINLNSGLESFTEEE